MSIAKASGKLPDAAPLGRVAERRPLSLEVKARRSGGSFSRTGWGFVCLGAVISTVMVPDTDLSSVGLPVKPSRRQGSG